MIENTYWAGKGNHWDLYKKLEGLIPSEGSVHEPRENPALEKLRRAANCYYDLFNNGLCNRAAEFRRVFGFGGTIIVKNKYSLPALERQLENTMDAIILAAAKEQNIS